MLIDTFWYQGFIYKEVRGAHSQLYCTQRLSIIDALPALEIL
jgi:hypothetical protein